MRQVNMLYQCALLLHQQNECEGFICVTHVNLTLLSLTWVTLPLQFSQAVRPQLKQCGVMFPPPHLCDINRLVTLLFLTHAHSLGSHSTTVQPGRQALAGPQQFNCADYMVHLFILHDITPPTAHLLTSPLLSCPDVKHVTDLLHL
jgi:hypothetical protein